jgi:predicted HAD superfamily Cof-like phosphohydrolase
MNLFEQAIQFRMAFNQPLPKDYQAEEYSFKTEISHCSNIELQLKLIREEFSELESALLTVVGNIEELCGPRPHGEIEDRAELLKEMADLVFVVYQLAAYMGWDLDQAMQRVFDSNMSKLDNEGKPIYREDGKVLKGPNYAPPNLQNLV